MTTEKRLPPGWGLLIGIAIGAFAWGGLGYLAWKWMFP